FGVRASRGLAAFAATILLSGCFADRDPPSGQPSFYRSLAEAGAQVDATAAQSMISGYRQNNGLSSVAIDADVLRLAEQQSTTTAATLSRLRRSPEGPAHKPNN